MVMEAVVLALESVSVMVAGAPVTGRPSASKSSETAGLAVTLLGAVMTFDPEGRGSELEQVPFVWLTGKP